MSPGPPRARIVAVTTDLRLTGSKRVLVDGARRLDRTRFDPLVLLLSEVDPQDPLRRELAAADVDVHVVPARARLSPSGLRRLARWIREVGRPDLLHTHCARSAGAVRLALALARPRPSPRVVVHFHGTVSHRARRARHRLLDRLLRPRTHLVLAPTTQALALGGAAHAYRGLPARVLPNGVDLARARHPARSRPAVRAAWGVPADAPVVLLLGRWSPAKGQDVLLEAAPALWTRQPSAHLVFVGPERHGAFAHAQAPRLAALPGNDRVHVLDADPEPASCYAAADVVVVPSREEPFGLVALEALAAGARVVAARTGGLTEIGGDADAVLWARPGDPTSLAEALEAALREPAAARAAREERGRRRAGHFDLGRYVARLERAYADVLRRPDLAPEDGAGDDLEPVDWARIPEPARAPRAPGRPA